MSIDIHSHILPGIDDGAKDQKEALEMLKIAVEDGISDIIVTPHFHYRRGHATPEQIRSAVLELQNRMNEEKIPIKLHVGNELYYSHDLIESVKAGDALTLADSDYVLLEFSPETEQKKIQNAIYQFLCEGYLPIIAHMERYQAFLKNDDFTVSVSDMGAYFQINAGSLNGDAGWQIKRFVRKMIRNGMIQFVATDAHDLIKRPARLGNTVKWIEKKTGESTVQELLQRNPQMILENKHL